MLFLVFAIAFSFYSANVGAMPASYGLLGSIAALMIFLQLTTISVIVGAEANSIVEDVRLEAEVRRTAEARAAARAMANDYGEGDDGSSSDLPFGKALAGLAALFVLGRSGDR